MARVIGCDVLAVDDARTGPGIQTGEASIIRDCRVEFGEFGIVAGEHSQVHGSMALHSSKDGIRGGAVNLSTAVNAGDDGIVGSSVFFSEAEAEDIENGEGGTGIIASKTVMASWGAGDASGIIADGGVSFSVGRSSFRDGIVSEGIWNRLTLTRMGGSVVHSVGIAGSEGDGVSSSSDGGLVFNSMGHTVGDGFSYQGIVADMVGRSYGKGDGGSGISSTHVSHSWGSSFEASGIDADTGFGIITGSYGYAGSGGDFGLKANLATGSLGDGGKDVTHEYDMP